MNGQPASDRVDLELSVGTARNQRVRLEGLRPAATTGLWRLARARGYCTIKVSFVLWVSMLDPAVALADTVIV
jgi:hypothetical protein